MRENKAVTFGSGTVIGALGGLIGLGGAEFRLPILIALFQFTALEAVILNKAMSLIVVASALPFRAHVVNWDLIGLHWQTVANILSGSLLGAWLGASWAVRLSSRTLYKTIALLLLLMAIVLLIGHGHEIGSGIVSEGWGRILAGTIAGFLIGIVAALMGVAGGELLIPTLILLYGVDIKLAGSLSLAISLPTMIVGFARYTLDQSFVVLRKNARFAIIMAAGSLAGAYIGGLLLGVVSDALLLPVLSVILVISAAKVWKHK